MKREVTEDQFASLREQMSTSECVVKTVPLASIQLDDKSIVSGRIGIGGVQVQVGSGFFQKLSSFLKVSRSLTSEMIKNEDGKLAASLMNGLKDYRQANGGSEIMLIANPTTREIVDICDPKRYRRMTNDSVMDVTQRIINENPGLTIETIDFNPQAGRSIINLLNNNEVGFPGAGKDEFFKFGFSIIQSPKDTIVEMYNQRLVCANGLRISLGQGAIGGNGQIHFEERFRLAGTGAEDIKTFLGKIEDMRKAQFIPGGFQQTLESAASTKASLLEVESAMIKAQRMVREQDASLKTNFIENLSRKYFGSYAETMARVVRKGQNPMSLNDKQKSFIKTGQSIWDVVNSLTYLGSNDSGLPLEHKSELKAEAGRLFAKGTNGGFDLQFAQFAQL